MRKLAVSCLAALLLVGSVRAGIEGSYRTDRNGHAQLEIRRNPAGYYDLQWSPDTSDEVCLGAGIESFGYLLAAELHNDLIAVFALADGKVDGVWASVHKMEIHSEQTPGVDFAEPATMDIAGTYSVWGEDNMTCTPFSHTMTIEPCQDLWRVTRHLEDEPDRQGVGVVVDDVLLIGFSDEDVKTVELLKLEDGGLYGDWMLFWFEHPDMVVSGVLQAVKIKEE